MAFGNKYKIEATLDVSGAARAEVAYANHAPYVEDAAKKMPNAETGKITGPMGIPTAFWQSGSKPKK